MPPATLVRSALPPSLARIMSCLGPLAFFQRPTISTGMGSGTVPLKTVQAVAFMPGLMSDFGKISTFPARGRAGVTTAASPQTGRTAQKIAQYSAIGAAVRFIIDLPYRYPLLARFCWLDEIPIIQQSCSFYYPRVCWTTGVVALCIPRATPASFLSGTDFTDKLESCCTFSGSP